MGDCDAYDGQWLADRGEALTMARDELDWTSDRRMMMEGKKGRGETAGGEGRGMLSRDDAPSRRFLGEAPFWNT